MITRTDIAAHLDRQVRIGFLNSQKAYTPLRSAFCGEVPSDGAFERHAAMGDKPWPVQNQGEGTTYGKAYDGLSFFNTAHIDPRAQYQTAQSNRKLLALSMDNFETVRVAGQNLLNDRGIPGGYQHNLLIVPPNLERIAAQ